MSSVVAFPKRPATEWHVERASPGIWFGRLVRQRRVVAQTEQGPMAAVLDVVVNGPHRGLPILGVFRDQFEREAFQRARALAEANAEYRMHGGRR